LNTITAGTSVKCGICEDTTKVAKCTSATVATSCSSGYYLDSTDATKPTCKACAAGTD